MPAEWMASWKNKNPGFEYRLWTEKNIKELKLTNSKIYDEYYNREKFDGAADVARVEILNRFGGVYIDADSICLNPLEDTWFDMEFFACYEYDDRIANGVIGSIPGHPILEEYIKRIKRSTVLYPPCYTIGGTMLTTCVDLYQDKSAVLLLPQSTFYPKWHKRNQIKDKIYSRQMWGTTKSIYKKT